MADKNTSEVTFDVTVEGYENAVSEVAEEGLLRALEGAELRQRERRELQTILVSKEVAPSEAEAKKKALKYGRADKVDETEQSFRFRQRPPSDFVEGSFRSFKPEEGVTLVFGQLKE